MAESDKVDVAPASSLWRSVKLVSWAFLGIRKGSEYRKDFAVVKPLHVIIVGVLLTGVFVLTLVGVVSWVVA